MFRPKLQIWCVLLTPIILCVLLAVNGAGALPNRADDLPNFQKVDDHLFRGAQPTEAGIAKLKELKVKTVVDLRSERDQVAIEQRWVENAGMKFINVPMSGWFRPKAADIERILKIIEDPQNQPVFIHCRHGADRTGSVAAVYRIADYDWTAKQALGEAKAHNFGWWQFWMKDFIKDYYQKHRRIKSKGAIRTRPALPAYAGMDVPLASKMLVLVDSRRRDPARALVPG